MIAPVPPHWGAGSKWRGGGVSTHVQGLLPALADLGVTLRLLADNARQSALQAPSIPGVQVSGMAQSPGALTRLGWRRAWRVAAGLARSAEIRRRVPPAQLARYWGQAINFDHFLAAAPYDLVHVQQAQHRQFLCQQVLGVTKPMLVTVQSVNELIRPNFPWLVPLVLANFQRADHLIAVSHYVRARLLAHGAPAARVTVIPNGVAIDVFAPASPLDARRQLGLPAEGFLALYTGHLIARKGVDVLLRAFAQALARQANARLALVGGGPEETALRRLAAELGIADRVHFAGYQDLPSMPAWYQACDVFVMPSWAEGLSLSVLEALACGRPVVTTWPDEGSHDAVLPGETGWLVHYGEVEELARTLTEGADSAENRQRLGHNARHLVESRFTWPRIAQETLRIYQALTGPSPNHTTT